jgi:glycosyltransferase involved in cell wall biosynthesis
MTGARPPTILFDADALNLEGGTGITTYAKELANAAFRAGYHTSGLVSVQRGLSNKADLNEVLLFDGAGPSQLSHTQYALQMARTPWRALVGLAAVEVKRQGFVLGSSEIFDQFSRLLAAPQLRDAARMVFAAFGQPLKLRTPDPPRIFHLTHPIPLRVRGCTNIITIHDLIPLKLPYTTLDNKRYYYALLKALSRKADHIVTVSESSKRDIIEFLKIDENRVTNTYQSVSIPQHVLDVSVDEVELKLRHMFNLEYGEYFLFFGAIEPKKNVSRLIDAYALAGTKRPLVIAGSGGWQNQSDLRKMREEKFFRFERSQGAFRPSRSVRHLRYLPRDQLLYLVRGARAVIFPSLYEGFGLPVVEAMLLGTPVVTSNTSSLPEVAADAALCVDPYSIEDISNAISVLDVDIDLCGELSSRGRERGRMFSPEIYDLKIRDLYSGLM